MVTSRSQTRKVEKVLTDDNTINVHISSTSKKRSQRAPAGDVNMEDEGTPSAKKRKILPVREKVKPAVSMSRLLVEIPARKATPKLEDNAGTPAKPIEIEDDSEDVSADEVDIVEKNVGKEPAKEEVKIDTQKTHKRFDSEEPGPELFSTAREIPEEIADSEEEEDSEDDAPEAIGIQQAAEEVKSKERSTAKAVKEQISATRKKRKERDEILKKQSETGKKRKLETALKPVPHSDSEIPDQEQPMEPPPAFDQPRLTSRSTLPEFLPAEYLEDSEPQDLMISTEKADRPKPKKTKFLEAKAPKDKRVGRTTYRVAKSGEMSLAPKVDFQAKSVKEKWLQGRSGRKAEPSRRPFGKAFGRR
ncbi:uncharacterized protein L3040_006656 [Drepanopeziza brunnea f. sp. 'multigermtubi']|nr:hypothetical protein L3040_006656 [Drepanopeziza brunnea f. sp. 'multigermtubi']